MGCILLNYLHVSLFTESQKLEAEGPISQIHSINFGGIYKVRQYLVALVVFAKCYST